MEEVVKIADSLVILKDGKNAGYLLKEEIIKDKMITLMVGRTLSDIYPHREKVIFGEQLMNVTNLIVGLWVKKKLHLKDYRMSVDTINGFTKGY